MVKKYRHIFLITLISPVILLPACNSDKVRGFTTLVESSQTTSDITLNISDFDFQTKSISPVKSFSAFLTTNYNNPFISGSNPYGNGVILKVNYTSGVNTLTFKKVPAGGPYYAVVAAFDTLTTDTVPNNITEADPAIPSSDKKWARSTNNASVTVTKTLVFSDSNTALKVNLKLAPTIVNTLPVVVAPVNGNSTSGAIGVHP
jgi:hypothetical protein